MKKRKKYYVLVFSFPCFSFCCFSFSSSSSFYRHRLSIQVVKTQMSDEGWATLVVVPNTALFSLSFSKSKLLHFCCIPQPQHGHNEIKTILLDRLSTLFFEEFQVNIGFLLLGNPGPHRGVLIPQRAPSSGVEVARRRTTRRYHRDMRLEASRRRRDHAASDARMARRRVASSTLHPSAGALYFSPKPVSSCAVLF